jgi:DNA-binding transcriptional LysR family regulator
MIDVAAACSRGTSRTISPASASATTIVIAFGADAAPPGPSVTVEALGRRTRVGPRRGSAVTRVLEGLFAGAQIPFHLALESGDPILLRSLAARGFGAAVLPRSLTEVEGPAVEVRRLDPRAPDGRDGLAPRSPALARRPDVIEFVRDEPASQATGRA